jgi:hypothetical protein
LEPFVLDDAELRATFAAPILTDAETTVQRVTDPVLEAGDQQAGDAAVEPALRHGTLGIHLTASGSGSTMRNIFDQYQQPENRLTHALATALDQDRSLTVPFLRWLGVAEIPKPRTLMLTEQQVPGMLELDAEPIDARGLPDAAIFDEDGWAALFESKIQACIDLKQVERHRRTAQRHGFETPWAVVISVDPLTCKLPKQTIATTWQDVYSWFNRRVDKPWAQQLVSYMQVFERKMLLDEYDIRGTITVFDGIRFTETNPYTYREGKRLIRLLGDLLQKRKALHHLSGDIGVNPTEGRRTAITGRGTDGVWDFLPLTVARDAKSFTAYPHLTMGIWRRRATAAITIPNGIRGGFRRKLLSRKIDGFRTLVAVLEKRLRPIIKRSSGAKPMMYVTQRHFRSMNSPGVTDARLEADLRTAFSEMQSGIRHQPQWIEAIYDILAHKRSNIQFGVDVQFSYDCPVVQSPECADLFADTWKALSPLLDFALKE